MHIDHHHDDPRDQPLPTPAQINDALQALFVNNPNALRLRLLALLQTPRYDLIRSQIMDLTVHDGHVRLGNVPLAIAGQDTPGNGAADNDWVRVVKPYLDQCVGTSGRLWPANLAHRRSEFPRSFEALAKVFPALQLVAGKQRLNLQHAVAAALGAAGVDPRRMMMRGTRGTRVLRIADVHPDGGCLSAWLSAAGRSVLRAWVEQRLRRGEDSQSPLFTFRKPKIVLNAIATQRRRVRDVLAARAGQAHDGVVSLPEARSVNRRILELFDDQPHPELMRACARLHVQPYWLGSGAINALRVVDGVLILQGRPVAVAPEDHSTIQRCLEAQQGRADGHSDIAFLSARDRRGVLRSASRNTPSIALGGLIRACPEYGFLRGAGSSEEALRALTAAVLMGHDVAVHRLCSGLNCLRLRDVSSDGHVAGLDLPLAARSVLAAWRQRRAHTDTATPLLGYASEAAVDNAVRAHRARLTKAYALAQSRPTPSTPQTARLPSSWALAV